MRSVQLFEQNLWDGGIIEPDRVHSEFSQGLHGQKIDFDKIDELDPLFDQWVQITAETVDYYYPGKIRPEFLVGVDGGTNRLVGPVAARLGSEVVALTTKKIGPSVVALEPAYFAQIMLAKPELVVVLEDAGTTGANAASAAKHSRGAGAQRVEAIFTWQRQPELYELDQAQIRYHSLIKNFLPTFTADECRSNPNGFCARNWKLNPYNRDK